ncbi:MAG TPA: Gfo/Idh/MocA family oxidoreductase [Candidatus Hydrogenedentes bacterium]|nr:Gfo/Idh/MocA family oxidoreductase [Candidatus Hydrogenedentota bacterium]HRK35545.1 Gfo/Idh/MocA family oxidoreductase [Candidatus Hydrogenedentota bacterium]
MSKPVEAIGGENTSSAEVSRRDFMVKSGTGLSAAALAAHHAFAVDTAPKKVRIGVVGGGFGCSFQWHEHPDCEVVAVSDLREDRRKRLMDTYRCATAYNSLEELVKDNNIDAVGIFTDGPLHVQHVVESMKHGKHCISAVPAAYGSLDEARLLKKTVKKYGLTYMMAETGYYQQTTIAARQMYESGKFGNLYYCEAEYQHPGLEVLYKENGKPTWRYGMAPMHYPTHSSSQLIGVTGERLVHVTCLGWGDDDPCLKDNVYKNPFWNGSAMFTTDRGHAFRMNVWWRGAHRGCERAQWIGDKMSLYMQHANGWPAVIVRSGKQVEKDDAGFERTMAEFEEFKVPEFWATDMLPEPLRHSSGHEGSHTFLTHEFIQSITQDRLPSVNVYEALAYTVPGIVAHESSLKGGEPMKVPDFDDAEYKQTLAKA